MLQHPSVGYSLNESVEIQGHKILFVTVDLGVESIAIKQQLTELIDVGSTI